MNNIPFNTQICEQRSSLNMFALHFTQNNNDADDLVQETLLKAMRYAEMYKDGTNLRGWLYTIMKNTFINNYRFNTHRGKVLLTNGDLTSLQQLKSADRNMGEGIFVNEDIHKALRQLSPIYYQPFIKYFEGFKYFEIAKELGIPLGTVKTRIHIARVLLKRNLRMYNEYYRK